MVGKAWGWGEVEGFEK